MPNTAVQFLVKRAVQRGLAVIPMGADKAALVPWRAYQTSKPTTADLERWWNLDPAAWAVVTGGISGVIVLDFDRPEGDRTMRQLGLQPHVRTGSGGHHAYFNHPGWYVPTVNGKAKQALGSKYPGLDVRGDGGVAIFAGRTTAGEYLWLRDMAPDPLDILPYELREALGLLGPPPPPQEAACNPAKPTSDVAARIFADALAQARTSGRNNAGFWLCCQMRDNGFPEEDTEAVMRLYRDSVEPTNVKGEVEPYTEAEALNSVRQAFSREPREPWQSPAGRESTSEPGESVSELPTVEVGNRELRGVSADAYSAQLN